MSWSGATFTRTNGTYSGTTVWAQDSGAGTKIISTNHDLHDQDLATGIQTCLRKDGGNTATADIGMGGNKLTNVGNAAALNQYISGTQAQNGSFVYVPTVGGTADVLTLTTGWTLAAYVAGQKFRFINSGGPNTGAATINVDTLGAKDIKRNDGSYTALSAGDMPDNGLIEIIYDGTRFLLVAGSGYVPGGTDVAVTDGGTGASTAAGAATNLGLGTGDSPQFTGVNIGHATDTTVTRVSAGDIQVEGNRLFRVGGTDVPVADGGTGASSAADARTNLGVAYAAQADQETATSTTTVVAPGTQHFHPTAAKAWVLYDLSAQSVLASHNVASVVRDSTGVMTVTFTTAFASANYAVVGHARGSASSGAFVTDYTGHTRSASAYQCIVLGAATTAFNSTFVSLAFYGDFT